MGDTRRRVPTRARRSSGIHAIEALVTDGVHLAKSGEITVTCGGAVGVVQRHMRLLGDPCGTSLHADGFPAHREA